MSFGNRKGTEFWKQKKAKSSYQADINEASQVTQDESTSVPVDISEDEGASCGITDTVANKPNHQAEVEIEHCESLVQFSVAADSPEFESEETENESSDRVSRNLI